MVYIKGEEMTAYCMEVRVAPTNRDMHDACLSLTAHHGKVGRAAH